MDALITILIVFGSIGFCVWLGYMWGKMTGYEEGFKACQRIHDEIQEWMKKY